LVVDGFLNTTDGLATVRLLHAKALSDPGVSTPETNATVTISSENGSAITLEEETPGVYTKTGIVADVTKKYQLTIKTIDHQIYRSDEIVLKQTPPMDSVVWKAKDNGLDILVNTHDDTGNTQYYRWDYTETWEYHAPHFSAYKLVNKEAVYREPGDQTYRCWRTVASTRILVGSSIQLSEDVIRNFPLVFIPLGSQKTSIKYSMLVQQRALTESEFNFWKDIQSITESLGGLFDTQPYQVTGNVYHSGDPSIPVLGFFGGGSVQQTRMYVDFYELPGHLQKLPLSYCALDTVCVYKDPRANLPCSIDLPNLWENALLVAPLFNGPQRWAYTLATPECADCRLQGGNLSKPHFWE
jgi:hypothetical protein